MHRPRAVLVVRFAVESVPPCPSSSPELGAVLSPRRRVVGCVSAVSVRAWRLCPCRPRRTPRSPRISSTCAGCTRTSTRRGCAKVGATVAVEDVGRASIVAKEVCGIAAISSQHLWPLRSAARRRHLLLCGSSDFQAPFRLEARLFVAFPPSSTRPAGRLEPYGPPARPTACLLPPYRRPPPLAFRRKARHSTRIARTHSALAPRRPPRFGLMCLGVAR